MNQSVDIDNQANAEFKISALLNDKNPLKKFMYNMENKKENGWLFKSFCIVCLIYSVSMQVMALIKANQYAWAMLPLTMVFCAYIFVYWNHVFLNHSMDILDEKIKKQYSYIYFILYISILIGLYFININCTEDECWLYIKFESFRDLFLVYSISVGFLLQVIYVFNNPFLIFKQYQIIQLLFTDEKKFYFVSRILVPFICLGLAYGTYDSFLSQKNNLFFQSLFLLVECVVIFAPFVFFTIFVLFLLRRYALYLNRFYKN